MPDTFDYTTPRQPTWRVTLTNVPYITILLCSLCVVMTAAYLIPPQTFLTPDLPAYRLWEHLGHLAYHSSSEIWEGRYDGLVTTMFLHGSLPHIVFNLMWLFQLGQMLELTLGRWRYLAFVLVAAVVGSCSQILVSGATGIGASGVVYALFGLMWAGRGSFPAWRTIATPKNLQIFVIWGIFCVVATLTHLLNIGNGAHGGGFLFGLSIGSLFLAPRRKLLWSLPLAALLVGCILSLTYLPWSAEWLFWKGNRDFEKGRYQQAISWYHQSLDRGDPSPETWANIANAWESIADTALQKHDLATVARAEKEVKAAMLKAVPTPEPKPTEAGAEDDDRR